MRLQSLGVDCAVDDIINPSSLAADWLRANVRGACLGRQALLSERLRFMLAHAHCGSAWHGSGLLGDWLVQQRLPLAQSTRQP